MPSYSVELGKGWREPCYPYRSGTVFGAELNTPDISVLNCNPEIVDPVTVLDLRQLTREHEAILCLVKVLDFPDGYYSGSTRWYRERDNALLYAFSWGPLRFPTGRLYPYSYIGYMAQEIAENGNYRCDVEVSGPYSFTATARFQITGLTEIIPTPIEVGAGLSGVINALQMVSKWCHDIYLNLFDWITPFGYIANVFHFLSEIFMGAANALTEFQVWVLALADQVTQVLSWEGIKGLILTWLPDLENVVIWFGSWVQNSRSLITDWWQVAQETVWGWITVATEGLTTLRANWDEFVTSTLPNLVSLSWLDSWWTARVLDVQNLINSAFMVRDSLWEGWQSTRDQVFDFLGNPVGYIWERFADWFFGGKE